jgi:hypothetical protein
MVRDPAPGVNVGQMTEVTPGSKDLIMPVVFAADRAYQ